VVVAVETAVSVKLTAAVPVMLTGGRGLGLQLIGLIAPDGAVTAQVSATLPVNPFVGVTVTVEVFPLVAPGAMLRFGLLVMVKPCALDAPLTMAVIASV
jgi:hypothetical protein